MAHVATTTTIGMSRTNVSLLHERRMGPLLSVLTERSTPNLGGTD
jgi:hypothetical protein